MFPERLISAGTLLSGVRTRMHMEDSLPPRYDELESVRHVILSTERGVVTELERVHTDQYIVRCHRSSADAGLILETGGWVGFRYRDAHWSFLKQ